MASANAAVSRHLRDGAMHLLGHSSVGGVSLRPRAQLDEVHRFTRVELHDVADAVRQRDRVRGLLGEVRQEGAVQVLRPSDRLVVALTETGIGDDPRHVVAERDAEPLPLDRQHSVTLQVAKRAVVGDELEAVVGPLEGAAGTVPSVAPVADVGLQQGDPVLVTEPAYSPGRLALGTVELRETCCHQDLLFAIGVEVEQGHALVARGSRTLAPGTRSGQSRDTTRAVLSRFDAR